MTIRLLLPLLCLAWPAPPPVEAQVVFRSAASSTALGPVFRAATSATLPVPAFRAAAPATLLGVGTLTIARPAGTVANDVMIAAVAVRPIAATIVPPAGWTLIRRTDNAAGNANSLAVYRRVAGAAEPVSYAFTIGGGSTHATGGIQSFSLVDINNPIDVENGQTTLSGLAHATLDVTTTVPNTMVVAAHSFASASSWTPPAGMTESFDIPSGAPAAVGQTTMGSRVLQAARGATGVRTATALADPDVGNTHILGLKPALRIGRPAGTALNDVLVASVGVQPSTAVVTPPAGWILIRRTDNAGPMTNSLLVYRRLATAAEPVFYDFSVSAVDFAVGGIQAFFNIDAVAPVDVENGQQTQAPPAPPGSSASSNHTAPSVTTTVANTMIVTSHTYASSRGWTPPAGMTESFERLSGAASATGQSIEGNRVVQAIAGATGTKTAVAATPASLDRGNTHILALKSPRPVLTINVPAGTVVNDVMIASVGLQPSTATLTAPAGWTLVRRIDNAGATTNSLVIYRRVATAAEPASYTWTPANFVYAAGGIQTFSGVDTTTPIDVENGQQTQAPPAPPGSSASPNHSTPSVTTTVANTMVVTSHSFASSATWTPPAGMIEAFDAAALTVPNAAGQAIEGNYVPQVAIGATGVKMAVASGNADRGNAHILALRPAPVVAAPGGFNAYDTATIAGSITGFVRTRIAGAAISLDIIALNPAKTAILTTFTGTVRVEVLNSSDNSGALDANACRPSWTTIQTLVPDITFVAGDNGRKTISFTVTNSFPNARLRIYYPAVAPTATGCSTDNFAIRPNTFANFSATDNDWQTAGITRTLNETVFTAGTLVHKAGRPFTVRADALNAAGVPIVTTNYTGTPTATITACPGAACTATFGTLTLGATFTAGQLNTSTASYSEVGSFRLQLVDSSFSAVDAADGSTAAERDIASSAIDVGRFVPDHFALSLNTPTFGAACVAGSFTYVGQAFNFNTQPVITVTAQNFASNPTALYAGAWARITTSSVTPATQAARYARFDALGGGTTPALDTAGLPLPAADPAISAFAAGAGTLTFSSGTGLGFIRSTTTPNAPFNADIALSLNVIDTDNVGLGDPAASFGAASAGNGIAFTGGKAMRFGRLRLQNALGSELIDLPIPMVTQYWNASAFVTNPDDSCTSLSAANLSLGAYTGGITGINLGAPGHISLGGAFAAGVGSLKLTKPSPVPTSSGSATLTVDLSAEAKSYLQGNWAGATYTANPSARATFGLYGSQPRNFIFFRENY